MALMGLTLLLLLPIGMGFAAAGFTVGVKFEGLAMETVDKFPGFVRIEVDVELQIATFLPSM